MHFEHFQVQIILLILVGSVSSGNLVHHKLIRARKDIAVPDVYFVHMKASVTSEDLHAYVQQLEEEQKRNTTEGFTANIHGCVVEAAHGFSAKLSPAALEMVADNPNVELVEQDHYIKAGETDFRIVSPWGVDRLDQEDTVYDNRYAAPCNLTGNGVDVYVLDSGILYSHTEFTGRAVYPGCDPIDQVFNNAPRNGSDCTGHGTHVAGTIAGNNLGVAPNVTIFSIRVLDCGNTGTINTLTLGLECALNKYKERKRPAIVNLSIYGEKDTKLKAAIDSLIKSGMTVVSIAGNNELNPKDACKVSPASVPGVITASASTRDDKAFHLSNAGTCVDLYAPGIDIMSATHICDTCHATRRGSSMAAPHVTGAIALLLEMCPNAAPWRVRHLLLSQMTQANVLDFSSIPNRFHLNTPNLLLHTSSLQCDIEC